MDVMLFLSTIVLLQAGVHCNDIDAMNKKDMTPQTSSMNNAPVRDASSGGCYDNDAACPDSWSDRGKLYFGPDKDKLEFMSKFLFRNHLNNDQVSIPWSRRSSDTPYWASRGRRQDRDYRSRGTTQFPLFVDEPQWMMLEHDIQELSAIDLGPFYVTRGRKKWFVIPQMDDGDDSMIGNDKRGDEQAFEASEPDFDYGRVKMPPSTALFDNREARGGVYKARSHKSAEFGSTPNVPFIGSRGKKVLVQGLKKPYWDANLALKTRSSVSDDQPFFAHRGKRFRQFVYE